MLKRNLRRAAATACSADRPCEIILQDLNLETDLIEGGDLLTTFIDSDD